MKMMIQEMMKFFKLTTKQILKHFHKKFTTYKELQGVIFHHLIVENKLKKMFMIILLMSLSLEITNRILIICPNLLKKNNSNY